MKTDIYLCQALLDYFDLNIWKKSIKLTQHPPFNAWPASEVKQTIYALVTLGILEKREGTNTVGAVYRLSEANVVWWKAVLEQLLQAEKLPAEMTFRMVYVLYVIGLFYLKNNTAPTQTELLGDKNRQKGLINTWLEESGAVAEDPHMISSAITLREITLKLAEFGYMIQRGDHQRRQPYLLTEKGLKLVSKLQRMHWSQWSNL